MAWIRSNNYLINQNKLSYINVTCDGVNTYIYTLIDKEEFVIKTLKNKVFDKDMINKFFSDIAKNNDISNSVISINNNLEVLHV